MKEGWKTARSSSLIKIIEVEECLDHVYMSATKKRERQKEDEMGEQLTIQLKGPFTGGK